MKSSVEREKQTVKAMVRIYCRYHHHQDLCEECNSVLNYAIKRIEKCIYGPEKPACNNCTTHCYSPAMKAKVKEIMRFSGPKMICKHPVMALAHLIKERRRNQQIINSNNK